MNIAGYIDHTILKPDTTKEDVTRVCKEAAAEKFAAVCIPPYYVAHANGLLAGTAINVATVIGFPLGYTTTQCKIAEAKAAIENGATELDIVHNIAALKSDDWQYLEEEIAIISELSTQNNVALKVIQETSLLTEKEIIRCCKTYSKYPIQYLKTSTGFTGAGANVETIALIRANTPQGIKIKASGGIRSFVFCRALIDAGADRIGCSASMKIVEESKQH